jgi:hypothetical protein
MGIKIMTPRFFIRGACCVGLIGLVVLFGATLCSRLYKPGISGVYEVREVYKNPRMRSGVHISLFVDQKYVQMIYLNLSDGEMAVQWKCEYNIVGSRVLWKLNHDGKEGAINDPPAALEVRKDGSIGIGSLVFHPIRRPAGKST